MRVIARELSPDLFTSGVLFPQLLFYLVPPVIVYKNGVWKHFPYEGDHTDEERFNQWRLRNYGQPLVHGHTHQTTPVGTTRPNQVCVSWEAWKRPVKLHEVVVALETGHEESSHPVDS